MSNLNANGERSSTVFLNCFVVPLNTSSNANAEMEWDTQRYPTTRTAMDNTCCMFICRIYNFLCLLWSRTIMYCSRWFSRLQTGEQGQALLGDTMDLTDPSCEPDELGMASRNTRIFVAKLWDNKPKQIQVEEAFHKRGYAPPRSCSGENSRRRIKTPNVSQRRAASGEAENESFRVHSDDESSVSSPLHSGVVYKEHWIMQHGVLMNAGLDRPLSEDTDSMMRRLVSVDGTYAHQGHGEHQIMRQGVYEEGGETSSITRVQPLIDDVAMVLDEIEAHRHPIHTPEQLIVFLERCADFLPVRIEVEREGTALPQDSTRSMEKDTSSTLEYRLHFLGPLRPNPYTAVLSIFEDVIMDDCDSNALRLVSIHCSDLCFSSHINPSEKGVVGMDSFDIVGDKISSRDEWQIKSDLNDVMISYCPLQKQQQSIHSLNVADGNYGGYQSAKSMQPLCDRSLLTPTATQDSLQLLKESHMRLLGILKNVMDNMANTIHSVRFTRCVFAPIDIGHSLPLTLSPLVELLFEQCPLSPAHIDALLQLARSETRRHVASTFSGSHPPPAFSRLTELQLSGSLTDECISELLSYFWDEVVDEKGTALRVLRLPSLLLRSAKGHPFIQAHPYVRVFPLA
ncbi:unnamed protein product [Phytomonas sp. Hart1]|nr:unnamed protein product [Phytomonas sp. Hart1]|eukprot:CCW68707.1 unnamed protein product [Phytomonas sp. isolate Hart1]